MSRCNYVTLACYPGGWITLIIFGLFSLSTVGSNFQRSSDERIETFNL